MTLGEQLELAFEPLGDDVEMLSRLGRAEVNVLPRLGRDLIDPRVQLARARLRIAAFRQTPCAPARGCP
jgi:hypothetical protein